MNMQRTEWLTWRFHLIRNVKLCSLYGFGGEAFVPDKGDEQQLLLEGQKAEYSRSVMKSETTVELTPQSSFTRNSRTRLQVYEDTTLTGFLFQRNSDDF